MKNETNTLAIFYGITPSKLAKLLKEIKDIGWPNQNENSAAYELSHTSYACDTEKKFIKIYLEDLVLRKKQGEKIKMKQIKDLKKNKKKCVVCGKPTTNYATNYDPQTLKYICSRECWKYGWKDAQEETSKQERKIC